jgi:hypothetical protein
MIDMDRVQALQADIEGLLQVRAVGDIVHLLDVEVRLLSIDVGVVVVEEIPGDEIAHTLDHGLDHHGGQGHILHDHDHRHGEEEDMADEKAHDVDEACHTAAMIATVTAAEVGVLIDAKSLKY